MVTRSMRVTSRLVPILSQRTVRPSFPLCSGIAVSTLQRKPFEVPRASPFSHHQRRWHTLPTSKNKSYSFEDVKKFSQNPSDERILIDVREPDEYSAGYIPTALNVPVKSAPEAWFLPAEDFEERFGFPKPDMVKEVVFYCRSGVRSSAAASIAERSGYTKIGEYKGSWLDWEKHGGNKSV